MRYPRWCAGGAAGSCGNSDELTTHPTPELDTELDARTKLRGARRQHGVDTARQF